VGKSLQFGVVGGNEGGDALPEQVGEDGARQGGALLWVRAGAKFIQDDERALIGILQDVDDVGDVPGEGTERLLDGLFIADIGKDIMKTGKL
jgi:hypothetical protein